MIFERMKRLCNFLKVKVLSIETIEDGTYLENVSFFRLVKIKGRKIISGREIIETDKGLFLKITVEDLK